MTNTASDMSLDTLSVTAVDLTHPTADSSATEENTEDSGSVIQTTIYAVVGVIGLIGNGFAIFVLCSSKRLRSKLVNKFLINQSAIDFTTAFFLLATCNSRFTERIHNGPGGLLLCQLWTSKLFLWSFMMSSTVNLLAINLERYLSVVHPIMHKTAIKKGHAAIVMSASWLIGPIYNVPTVVLTSFVDPDGACKAMAKWPSTAVATFYGVLTAFLQYFIPITVLAWVYLGMYYSLKKRNTTVFGVPAVAQGQLASVPVQPALPAVEQGQPASALVQSPAVTDQSGGGPRTTQPNNSSSRSNPLGRRVKKNILKTLAVVSLCFAVCLGPNQIYYFLINVGIPLSFNSPFFDFSVYMMVLNCVINPFIYSAQYSEFKTQVAMVIYKPNRVGGQGSTEGSNRGTAVSLISNNRAG